MAGFTPQNNRAYQALDIAQEYYRIEGYGVNDVSGGDCEVTVNTGNLDAADTVQVASGNAFFNGNTVSVSQTNVQINSVSNGHRRDVIWIDSNGNVQKTEGPVSSITPTAEESDAGLSRFEFYSVEVPKPGTEPAAVVGAIAVNDTDTSVSSNQIEDRRVESDVKLSSVETEETHTKTIGATEYHYAGDYDGSDPDTRLDNAISAAASGEMIYLEDATYNSARTISTEYDIRGINGYTGNGTEITADWTLSAGFSVISHIRLSDATVSITGNQYRLVHCRLVGTSDEISVGADFALLTHLRDATVTFQSGTSGGLVDASTNVSVTDNGTNTVGDNG